MQGGLDEALLTTELQRALGELDGVDVDVAAVHPDDLSHVLAQHVAGVALH